jgi:DNA invertase Pin-like site-specific DNA recombinase
MSEFYARDTSRKIKSVLHSKGRDGKPLGTVPIYGFKKDPANPNVRIIDDEAAESFPRRAERTLICRTTGAAQRLGSFSNTASIWEIW